MVVLGAEGDLSHRKLMPALFHLAGDGHLPDGFTLIGVARRDHDDDGFRASVKRSLAESKEAGPKDEGAFDRFARRLFYVKGDLNDPAMYGAVRRRLEERERQEPRPEGRLFYLAVPPSLYASTVESLSRERLAARVRDPDATPWIRVVIEKPFGRSRQTARELNRLVNEHLSEHQVFRIDHYLGKDTSRTSSCSASPTPSSSPSGAASRSTTSRSPPPRPSASSTAPAITRRPAWCGTCSRTTCSSS